MEEFILPSLFLFLGLCGDALHEKDCEAVFEGHCSCLINGRLVPWCTYAIIKLVYWSGLKGEKMDNIENTLYEQFQDLDINQLEEIAKNENGAYTEDAQEAAKAFLGNEEAVTKKKIEDENRQKELERQQQKKAEAEERTKTNMQQQEIDIIRNAIKNDENQENYNINEDVHQIARDVRWFKNLTIILLIISITYGVILGIAKIGRASCRERV